jgi:hypothetical protein
VKELVEDITKDMGRFQELTKTSESRKGKRTRKRVEQPKQRYLYASQKVVSGGKTNDEVSDENGNSKTNVTSLKLDESSPVVIAKQMGMNPSVQTCEAAFATVATRDIDESLVYHIINIDEPKVVASVRLGEEENDGFSSMYAYIFEKPAGWSILESTRGKEAQMKSVTQIEKRGKTIHTTRDENNKTKKYNDKDIVTFDEIDYDPRDILSVMTPEEIEQFECEGGFDGMDLIGLEARNTKEAKDVLSEYEGNKHIGGPIEEEKIIEEHSDEGLSEEVRAFVTESKPSLLRWFKNLKSQQGTPIRGGKFWMSVAGAVDVDDSGLVLLCPKDKVDKLHVDCVTYTAVIGTGKFLASKGKKRSSSVGKVASQDDARVDMIAKLKKGRDEDVVLTAAITLPDGASTTHDVVNICQNKFSEGIRGDPEANPLDRRASRRLIHCNSIAVSSLSHDDATEVTTEIPDDIRIYSDRRSCHKYEHGSFLGRNSLRRDPHTTAYREINGEADGYPGWIVDRYDKWLFVQHDENYERGPLPSIHDGYTAGVYYFPTERDRSVTGGKKGIKPVLLEGKAAPDLIPIKENGITYLVSFDDLSTGMFLDQRNQRSWLSRVCTPNTKVLNCFSHCGAFSIASATAGAKTVNLDLERKWLDRIEPQLVANGIDNADMKHDTIYGDCEFLFVFFSCLASMKLILKLDQT